MLSRMLFALGQSELRFAIESIFGRRLIQDVSKVLGRLNSAERNDRHGSPFRSRVEFDAEILQQLCAYYENADTKFTELTGHVPAYKLKSDDKIHVDKN